MPGRSKQRPAGAGVAAATRLVEIAHHWRAAQDSTRALSAAIAAGDASRAVYAYAEAGRQYERAIELWDLVPATDRPTDRDLADLFDAASATATLVGDASHAVDLAQRAIELIDADSRRRPRTAGARAGTVRVRVVAGRRHRDVDPLARGGHRPARRGAAVDR